MLEMLSVKTSLTTLTTCVIVVLVVVRLSSAMSASVASFHVGLRSPKQNYAAPVVPFHLWVCGMQQADRRNYLNMPKSNMPKHVARRNMPEGPHLCMQMTKHHPVP